MALYVAIVTPVASAKAIAGSKPPRPPRNARHGCWSTMNPAINRTTPTEPATPSRSPNSPTPIATASSGAVPRAIG